VDIEPLCVLVFNLNHPFHGFFHSFLGGSVAAILVSIVLYLLKGEIKKIMAIFKLAQNSSFKKILWTSFFGIYFHILLDSPLYRDIRPFYPMRSNPLYGLFSSQQIYLFCSLSFLLGIVLYLFRLLIVKRNKNIQELKFKEK